MTLENTIRSADTSESMYRRAGDGRQLRVITDLVTIRVNAAEAGRAFSLFETVTPPGGGCPPHTQRYDDETFYVLEGSYDVLVGDQKRELGPGDVAFVPRDTLHAYANTGSAPARMLMLVTPGGIKEQFFDEVGDSIDRSPWKTDMTRVLAVAPKYGMEFSSPATSTAASDAPGDGRDTTVREDAI